MTGLPRSYEVQSRLAHLVSPELAILPDGRTFLMKNGLAFAALTISTIGAFAADLPARTYTKAPVVTQPVYNWTGFYGGLEAGGVWANTDINSTASQFGFNGAPGGIVIAGVGQTTVHAAPDNWGLWHAVPVQ